MLKIGPPATQLSVSTETEESLYIYLWAMESRVSAARGVPNEILMESI